MLQYDITYKDIIFEQHYLAEATAETNVIEPPTNNAYLNAYLFTHFGIIVDKPKKLTTEMVKYIAAKLYLTVPQSFYKNPQDIKYYTKEQLYINQVVAYFLNYGKEDSSIDLFKPNLPNYVVGDEWVLRRFEILSDYEVDNVLYNIGEALLKHTRPFSYTELETFKYLWDHGFINKEAKINCKDNIFALFDDEPTLVESLAAQLDKKDLVKYSIQVFGDAYNFIAKLEIELNDKYRCKTTGIKNTVTALQLAIPLVKDCPLSRKQAKYFNKLCQACKIPHSHESNSASPYREYVRNLKAGNAIAAAKSLVHAGSLLERNLKAILSRTQSLEEATTILDMLSDKNPIALYQLICTISEDAGYGSPRTFKFTKNKLTRKHTETDYETTYRKSTLSDDVKALLKNSVTQKVYDAYTKATYNEARKVYISPEFYSIALPVNTSSTGSGLDVLPTGSRIPCPTGKIRTFVHWEDAFDIDSSLLLVKDDGTVDVSGFWSYSNFAAAGLLGCSGDITSPTGTEYYDIDVDKLKAAGYTYVVQCFNGYRSDLNTGKIYTGLQLKTDFMTEAWDPKNIEFQYRIKGNTRAALGYAIDLKTKEIIILNLLEDSNSRLADKGSVNTIKRYLQKDYLNINMGTIISCRGSLVDSPEDADEVYSRTYVAPETPNQHVIHPYDIGSLIELITLK